MGNCTLYLDKELLLAWFPCKFALWSETQSNYVLVSAVFRLGLIECHTRVWIIGAVVARNVTSDPHGLDQCLVQREIAQALALRREVEILSLFTWSFVHAVSAQKVAGIMIRFSKAW